MTGEPIGIIGVGMIATPMVENLQQAGVELILHDIEPEHIAPFVEKGAAAAASPREVADQARIVFVSLPLPGVVRDVALGPDGIIEGAKVEIYVDLSTTGALMAAEVAVGLEAEDIQCLDCPVSGGLKGSREGTLSLMISGPEAAAEAAAPYLDIIGNRFYIGPERGLGQTMKCCNNFITAATTMALAEALVVGAKAGLDGNRMLDILNASTARSRVTEEKMPDLINKGVFQGMASRLIHKDISLFVQESESYGLPAWMGNTVKSYLAFALANGLAEKPSSLMIGFLEKWAGVQVRKKVP